MSEKTRLQQAILDPASVYHNPVDVLNDESLSDQQRLEILRSWELDARELDVAREEGMLGGEENSLLEDILAAIDELDIPDTKHTAPNKQGSHSA
ncbi:MAG: hypothetical protein PVG75_00655 [Thioalkalispiraceae bacterium]|jgi:hypothetical protein